MVIQGVGVKCFNTVIRFMTRGFIKHLLSILSHGKHYKAVFDVGNSERKVYLWPNGNHFKMVSQ